MWYFTWVLGIAAALSLGIINVMWFEAEEAHKRENANKQDKP